MRGKRPTGFMVEDKATLQKLFDEEFINSQEERKAKRQEKLRKQAQQLGLQRRRMLMEKTLQEEQDELAKDHQIGMLIDLIKENQVQDSLRVNVNSITARSLAKALWVNENITCLDLSNNSLNDHAGSYLARVLKRNRTLRKLEVDNNLLGSKAAAAFGEALAVNRTLSTLNLDSNELVPSSAYDGSGDITGVAALAEALKVNSSLTAINLWRTGLTQEAGALLAAAISQNDTLLFCDVGMNFMDVGDVRQIAEKLDDNLRAFELRERDRRQQQAEADAQHLKEEDAAAAEQRRVDLAKWLQERREERAEDRRQSEQNRIFKIQEEAEERKRLRDLLLAEEKKAAESAAEKKGKKKGDKKKK